MTTRDPGSDPDGPGPDRPGPDEPLPDEESGLDDGSTSRAHAADGPGERPPGETGADKETSGDRDDNEADMASSNEDSAGEDAPRGPAPGPDASDSDASDRDASDDGSGTDAEREGSVDSPSPEEPASRDEVGSEEGRSDGGASGLDPLDVTEEDLDTSEVDDEDLDRLVELLDEARDDPDTVEGRDFENMLAVFDDAGIDTTDLEVEDLEDRFDESLKVSRMLVTAAANTGEYAGLAGLRAGGRMAEAAFTSESPRDFLEETSDIARDELDRLGLPFGGAGRSRASADSDGRGSRRPDSDEEDGPTTAADLRQRGQRLLELSADVDHEEPFHPAYVRVVEQLSADEARILRLLATEGPQPALDVYDRGLIPFGDGSLVADGLTMLDTDAGLRYEDRADVYIDNLERLGLVSVEPHALEDLSQYRVLQAQPNVERAEEAARRPSTRRGSVRLTPMGIDFCRTVFPFEVADRYDGAGNGSADD